MNVLPKLHELYRAPATVFVEVKQGVASLPHDRWALSRAVLCSALQRTAAASYAMVAAVTDDLQRYIDMQRRAEAVLAASPRSRVPAWQVPLRIGLVVALYAGLVYGAYAITRAWWGILLGIALPWIALLGYAVVTHSIGQRRAAQDARDRRELAVLNVDLDIPAKTARYAWNGPPALVPALALTQLANKLDYYQTLPWHDQLLARARELASARLAGQAPSLEWRAVPGHANTRACDLAEIRGQFHYAGHSWIGPGKPMPDDDIEAVVALLHHALSQPGAEVLARAILALENEPAERGRRRQASFHAAVAPLVAP